MSVLAAVPGLLLVVGAEFLDLVGEAFVRGVFHVGLDGCSGGDAPVPAVEASFDALAVFEDSVLPGVGAGLDDGLLRRDC
ncbi:hypothetical protein STRTUCAR8_01569 [Streptomyces turgidiscabies Car8]|uniref:Uncharacterized protein n=1 Tax=Streptomyces turgidiscabies (strain Car8) TaxID=698760 RepID=L7F4G8_STRT8|nr:hypothetical protein STRTUCAR8_01569 [Streptomyces turgidiscabies Car8]